MKIMEIFEPNQTPQSDQHQLNLTDAEIIAIKSALSQYGPSAPQDELDIVDNLLDRIEPMAVQARAKREQSQPSDFDIRR